MLRLEVTSLLASVVLGALVIYFVRYIWKRRWLYYHASKLEGPFAFPIIGSAYLFLGGQEPLFDQIMGLFEKYNSPVARLWFGSMLFVSITKPDDIEKVLNTRLKKPQFYDFAKPFVGKGVATAPVEIWRPHRKIINLTFNPNILRSFMGTFVDKANELVRKFDQRLKKDVDPWPFMFDTTLNSICETSLGSEVKGMDGTKQYINWISRSQEVAVLRLLKFWLHSEFLWQLSPLSKEMKRLSDQIKHYLGKIVESKKTSNGPVMAQQEDFSNEATILPQKKIFLDLLLTITDVPEKWENEELVDEINTMVIAGSETTALAVSSAMVMLAMHQHIQSNAHEEVFDIFGDSNRPCTLDDLSQMRYLELIIKETMRLFPIVPFLPRAIDEDLKLGNKTVPKGAIAAIPIMMLHRSAQYWKDPLKFDPERFLPEQVAKRPKYAYMPFSMGPRDCAGKGYAMMSMKVFLSTILRNFRLLSTPYKCVEDIQFLVNPMVRAKNGYKIQMERRENTLNVVSN